MMTNMWRVGLLVLAAHLASTTIDAAEEKIRVLIIDGQNNHDWRAMTPPMKADLEETGRFTVDVATTPEKGRPKSEWESFQPTFSNYDVVLSNYNGEPWPEAVNRNLETFVQQGGGLVIIHAANNAFPGWKAWNEMIGLGWRDNKFGNRLTLDNSGEKVLVPAGTGPGAGHGPQHAYLIITRDREHPVMAGLPTEWMHAKDELYHGQRGPVGQLHVLATAYSDAKLGGTGAHEPMIWWIPYGKGRVFTNVMGHVGGGQTDAIRCVGFKTTMLRGTEWAATGKVTLPVPSNFPTASAPSLE